MTTPLAPAPSADLKTAVLGDPATVLLRAQHFAAAASHLEHAMNRIAKAHADLGAEWKGLASGSGQRAGEEMAAQLKATAVSLREGAGMLHVLGNALQSAQNAQKGAATTYASNVQTALAANPADPAAAAQLQTLNAAAGNAHSDIALARARFVHSIEHVTLRPVLKISPNAKLTAVQVLELNHLVSAKKLSAGNATVAARQFTKLSKHDRGMVNSTLLHMQTDKGEATIYKDLAKHKSVKAISAMAPGAGSTVNGLPFVVPAGATTFTGVASMFNDHTTSTGTPADSNFGVSIRQPGTNYDSPVNMAARNGYWLIKTPDGRAMVLQQIDVGPNQSLGPSRLIDLSQPASNALNFPGLQGGYRATFLGHDRKWAQYNGKIFKTR